MPSQSHHPMHASFRSHSLHHPLIHMQVHLFLCDLFVKHKVPPPTVLAYDDGYHLLKFEMNRAQQFHAPPARLQSCFARTWHIGREGDFLCD